MVRKGGKPLAIVSEVKTQALGTLNNQVALLIGTKVALTEEFRMLKSQISAFAQGMTDGDIEGLHFGLAHGDLSVAEIAAVLVAEPTSSAEIDENQVALRPVWLIGALDANQSAVSGYFVDLWGNGSPAGMVIKPRWTFKRTTSWNWFIWNNTGSNLQTGGTVRMVAKSFGMWLD